MLKLIYTHDSLSSVNRDFSRLTQKIVKIEGPYKYHVLNQIVEIVKNDSRPRSLKSITVKLLQYQPNALHQDQLKSHIKKQLA